AKRLRRAWKLTNGHKDMRLNIPHKRNRFKHFKLAQHYVCTAIPVRTGMIGRVEGVRFIDSRHPFLKFMDKRQRRRIKRSAKLKIKRGDSMGEHTTVTRLEYLCRQRLR